MGGPALRWAALAVRLLWLVPATLLALAFGLGFGVSAVKALAAASRGAPFDAARPVIGGLVFAALAWVCVRGWARAARLAGGREDASALEVLLPFALTAAFAILAAAVLVPKARDYQRYVAEGSARGSLGVLRSGLAAYRSANNGLPPDLHTLAASGAAGAGGMPALWVSGGTGAGHARLATAADIPRRETRDTGGWAYVNAPGDADFGSVFIDCTHTDSKGTVWSSY